MRALKFIRVHPLLTLSLVYLYKHARKEGGGIARAIIQVTPNTFAFTSVALAALTAYYCAVSVTQRFILLVLLLALYRIRTIATAHLHLLSLLL